MGGVLSCGKRHQQLQQTNDRGLITLGAAFRACLVDLLGGCPNNIAHTTEPRSMARYGIWFILVSPYLQLEAAAAADRPGLDHVRPDKVRKAVELINRETAN